VDARTRQDDLRRRAPPRQVAASQRTHEADGRARATAAKGRRRQQVVGTGQQGRRPPAATTTAAEAAPACARRSPSPRRRGGVEGTRMTPFVRVADREKGTDVVELEEAAAETAEQPDRWMIQKTDASAREDSCRTVATARSGAVTRRRRDREPISERRQGRACGCRPQPAPGQQRRRSALERGGPSHPRLSRRRPPSIACDGVERPRITRAAVKPRHRTPPEHDQCASGPVLSQIIARDQATGTPPAAAGAARAGARCARLAEARRIDVDERRRCARASAAAAARRLRRQLTPSRPSARVHARRARLVAGANAAGRACRRAGRASSRRPAASRFVRMNTLDGLWAP